MSNDPVERFFRGSGGFSPESAPGRAWKMGRIVVAVIFGLLALRVAAAFFLA